MPVSAISDVTTICTFKRFSGIWHNMWNFLFIDNVFGFVDIKLYTVAACIMTLIKHYNYMQSQIFRERQLLYT